MAKDTTQKTKEKKSSITSEIKKTIKDNAKPQKKEKPKTISFGCLLFDILIGGGLYIGAPFGKIINIVGDSSSGKTFLTTEAIAATRAKYPKHFKWNLDDAETGFTFDNTDAELNVENLYDPPIVNEDTYKSEQIEEFDVNTQRFLKKKINRDNQVGLYALDSLDGLTDKEKKEREQKRYNQAEKGKEIKDDGTYGTSSAKFLSQEFFKNKAGSFSKKNSTLLIISQVREKLNAGPFEKKLKRSGGKALDFYAWAVVWLANICKIKRTNMYGEEKEVGIFVKANLDKSKTPRPYRNCSFIFYFDYGIDDIGTSINYLYDVWGPKGLKATSKAIPWDGGKERTVKNLKLFLTENESLDDYKEFRKKLDGKTNVKIDEAIEFILDTEDLKDKFSKEFGEMWEYEKLCKAIDEDPEMKKELDRRVIQKWEDGEASIRTQRKRKY